MIVDRCCAPKSARRCSTSWSPTSPRSTSRQSSTPPTARCSAAAGSTAPSIARPGRSCSRNARRWAAATPARPRSPRATGSKPATSSMRSARFGAAGVRTRKRCSPAAIAPRSISPPRIRLASIAYPAISTGIYRFPADLAARIAVGTVASEIAAKPRGIDARGVLLLRGGERGASQGGVRGIGVGVSHLSSRSPGMARSQSARCLDATPHERVKPGNELSAQ